MKIRDKIVNFMDRFISFVEYYKWEIITPLTVFLVLWLGFNSFKLALIWIFLVMVIIIVMVIYQYFNKKKLTLKTGYCGMNLKKLEMILKQYGGDIPTSKKLKLL